MTDTTPTKYNVEVVETVILEVVAVLHPKHLSAHELMEILGDPGDGREVEVVGQAIRNLREFGLFRGRDDEIVEPTQAALRAVALLTK